MADFSSMLKYLRQREGLSQRELAAKLQMAPSTIGMYESGKRRPGHVDEEAIADFFNVDLNTLRGIRINENAENDLDEESIKFAHLFQDASEEERALVMAYLKKKQPKS